MKKNPLTLIINIRACPNDQRNFPFIRQSRSTYRARQMRNVQRFIAACPLGSTLRHRKRNGKNPNQGHGHAFERFPLVQMSRLGRPKMSFVFIWLSSLWPLTEKTQPMVSEVLHKVENTQEIAKRIVRSNIWWPFKATEAKWIYNMGSWVQPDL